jgi:hypothetical protein
MQKYTVSELHGNGHVGEDVYLASDVDARIAELETRAHDLSSALRELLQDTQHVDHDCGSSPDLCPVVNARLVLEESWSLMDR